MSRLAVALLRQYVLFTTPSDVNRPATSVGDAVSGIFHHRYDRRVYSQEQEVRSSQKWSQEIEMHVQTERWDEKGLVFMLAPT